MKWIKCSDRLPSKSDADGSGAVVLRTQSGVLWLDEFFEIDATDGEWLAGACERETQSEQERSE